MRKCLCASAALVLAIAAAGCGSGKSQTASTGSGSAGSSKSYPELHWGVITFPGPIDWTKNVSTGSQLVAIESLAVQNLMEFEPNGKVKPGLASSVEHPDPTTYVYHIRSGVRFSDGRPLTVADVVYSLDRNVYGKEAWAKAAWEDVASITGQSSSAVVIKLKRPSATWNDVLAFTGEVSEKAQAVQVGEKALGTPGHLPIGTGPWKLDSYKPEASVQLSRNPYWNGSPQPAEKITVSLFKTEASEALALRSNEIAGTFNYLNPRVFSNIPGVSLLAAPGNSVNFIGVNTRLAPFTNVHVRRALAYATDAEAMINALFPGGTATADQTFMPASLFKGLGSEAEVDAMLSSLPKYDYDLAAAKRELAKSPYPHGFTTKIEVEATAGAEVSCAEIFASDLAKIGITAKVDTLAPDEVAAMFGKKVTIDFNEYYSGYPDPESLMSFLLLPSQIEPPGTGLNFAQFVNEEVNRLEPESLEAVNPQKRLQLIGKLLHIVGEEAPYWPLYSRKQLGAISDKYVWPSFSAWTMAWTAWAMDVKLAS
jgi:peptide/nickel transport system substrate-binding protein